MSPAPGESCGDGDEGEADEDARHDDEFRSLVWNSFMRGARHGDADVREQVMLGVILQWCRVNGLMCWTHLV